jgi:hypothetical protein
MNGTPLPRFGLKAFDATVIHGCCAGPIELYNCVPFGHQVSRARLRHLRESERIVVTDAAVPVGLAAYKRADGEIRVAHEFLLDRTLSRADTTTVTDVLLSAIEMVAYEDRVSCLTFLLRNGVVIEAFERRGYMSLVLECRGIWLQRKLGWPGWCDRRSERPN